MAGRAQWTKLVFGFWVALAAGTTLAEDLGFVRVGARVDGGRTIVLFNGAQIARGLILTCGHCCRSAGGRGAPVTVQILSSRPWEPYRTATGIVLCYDMTSDVGLVELDDSRTLDTVYQLAPRGTLLRPGEQIIAYRWQSDPDRLFAAFGHITRVDPYLGPSTIETTTLPRSGESGGPLVLADPDRRWIIGVTSAADTRFGLGIYCGLEPVYKLLEQCQQLDLVEEPSK